MSIKNNQQVLHDYVELKSIAGSGGDGVVSFRREAYVPKGGPDGGDGGQGGSVVLIGDHQITTLYDLYRTKLLQAKNGENGSGRRRTGKSAPDLQVKVPLGCEVYELDNKNNFWQLLGDITQNNQSLVVVKGGKGGLGNWHYRSATNQVPRYAKPGNTGEKKEIKIVLKFLADVGLIGLPNVGKSTLLSRISDAKPKIADYAFTTLAPNLGVVQHKGKSFVAADIPGLIEGASSGKGLGYQFLQHIERTKIIVHLLDATSVNIKKDYETIRSELKKYSKNLVDKPEIIVINKIDLNQRNKFPKAFKISSASGEGLTKLLDKIIEKL